MNESLDGLSLEFPPRTGRSRFADHFSPMNSPRLLIEYDQAKSGRDFDQERQHLLNPLRNDPQRRDQGASIVSQRTVFDGVILKLANARIFLRQPLDKSHLDQRHLAFIGISDRFLQIFPGQAVVIRFRPLRNRHELAHRIIP